MSVVPRTQQRGAGAATAALAAFGLLVAGVARPAPATVDMRRLQDEAVSRIERYVRIDTTNPPGNEQQAVEFFAKILAAEGIPYHTAQSAPGRGNIWARLKGGSKPALLLLSHMDVVPADRRYWHADPFAATVRNGEIWGRGTLDTKTLGIVELEAFLALHRSHQALDRDVIFMATADEEAGAAYGAGWMMQHHPESFAGAGYVLNEGGGGDLDQGRERFGIEVTQKVPFWIKLTATGTPRHGSDPQVASAVNHLVRALYRLQTYQFAPRILPAVDRYFKGLAPSAPPQWRAAFADIAATAANPDALLRLQTEYPGLAALTRNTCSITMLNGSAKINVIPAEADAQLDCRLLPDQDPAAFERELAAAINDPAIRMQTILVFKPGVSPLDTPLYRAIVDVTHRHYPQAAIVPAVATGFTDSHFFRDRGIAAYGYAPFLVPHAEESGIHGNDERISIDNVRRGTRMMYEIVREMTAGDAASARTAR
ncbi:MAG: M20/M25/M40 family metallo-hydrolase [Gammaproteobacteria bacterium]|nr:M20/M25/M40 family metallo-hydrolase [Gammaproteobacteria bacterium]